MTVRIINADCREALRQLDAGSVHCCVTSPPYFGLRDYENPSQIGLEPTPDEFVEAMVTVFREVRRVLRGDGTLWLNLGDSYCSTDKWGGGGNIGKQTRADDGEVPSWAVRRKRQAMEGIKPKDLIGIPWMVAFALRADGWFLRSEVVWAKPNGMPGSQQDRCTSSHEAVFLLTKKAAYWSDFDAIKTPPRESTLIRKAQDVQAQAGSHRANGGAKTNGPMKAVGGIDKQRGHSRRHAGFNDRWDAMEKAEQQSKPAMMRDVWFVPPGGYDEAHFAVMPEEIARRCVLAGCPYGGTVLDPFGGAGTTGLVADRLGRDAVLTELNPKYVAMARARIERDGGMFTQVEAA
ncbi:site-specific DNA-methyltransferase [Bosea sp. RCC_152_1]|uniref:DNA-methyltransferase n=1 Tax=Bosea sp. RCC_152_1 TaxID=3239228 RepID=UPI003525B50D